jgi:hypothetical protein
MLPLFATTVTTNGETMSSAVQPITVNADLSGFLAGINWAAPTWDLFIVLFFIITVFLYGMSLGRDRVIVILVSIYMALAVVSNAPFLGNWDANVNVGEFFAFRVTTFLGMFVLLFFLMSRSALHRAFGKLASGSWWQVLLFSTFHVGLLVSITLSFLPEGAIGGLAPLTQTLFSTDIARFVWIVAPIVGMVLIKTEE